MKTKEQMSEMFLQFLKDENFYEEWMEGYNLDNDIMKDYVELDWFLENCNTQMWLYNGCSLLAVLDARPLWDPEGLLPKYDEWRERNLERWMELDEKWRDIVGEIYLND